MLSTTLSYRLISDNSSNATSRISKRSDIAREVRYYSETIHKIQSAEEFIGNPRLLNFAMTAFGLQDLTYAKGLIRKLLSEGIDSSSSLANRISDTRFKEFAKTFDFKGFGVATTSFDRAQLGVVDRFYRQKLETEEGEQNEGVRLALYFERVAPTITSPYGILADAALTKVVQTALGLPAAVSAQSIEKQSALIQTKLNLSDFQDPAKLRKFIDRFTGLYELQRSQPDVLPKFQNFGSVGGLSLSVLQSLQNIRLRG